MPLVMLIAALALAVGISACGAARAAPRPIDRSGTGGNDRDRRGKKPAKKPPKSKKKAVKGKRSASNPENAKSA